MENLKQNPCSIWHTRLVVLPNHLYDLNFCFSYSIPLIKPAPNSVYKKWHRNICAKFQHSTSATAHTRKTLYYYHENIYFNQVLTFVFLLSIFVPITKINIS